MTNKEALRILMAMKDGLIHVFDHDRKLALGKAIEAIENSPAQMLGTSDTISRQAAIDEIMGQPPEPHYPSWYAEQIKNLPSAQPKELQILARALDGCPLTDPCDKLWKSEGWCWAHCKPGQYEPDAECWIRYAEVVANEER